MAQTGCLVVCGDAGDALGDSIYEARLYVRGTVAGLGADCIEKEMRDEHVAQVRELLARGRDRRRRSGRVPTLRLGPQALQLHDRQRGGVLMSDGWQPGLRESALFDRNVIAEIQRAAREGIYDIRGFGAKRKLPHFDDLLFLGASVSRYPARGLPRALRHERHARHALREEAARAEDPGHDRRHELRRALGAGEGGARPRRDRDGHLDDDR